MFNLFHHVSVLLQEAVEGLHIKPNGIYVDCTLGGAGHSYEILKKLEDGHLFCFDQDDIALNNAKNKLAPFQGKFTLIKSNFRYIKEQLNERGIMRVDGRSEE